MKCSICPEEAVGCFVNPYNPNDRGYYCLEHLKSITKCFGCFEELHNLVKIGLSDIL